MTPEKPTEKNGTLAWRVISLALLGIFSSGVLAYIAHAEVRDNRQDDMFLELQRELKVDNLRVEKRFDDIMESLGELHKNQNVILYRLGAATKACKPFAYNSNIKLYRWSLTGDS